MTLWRAIHVIAATATGLIAGTALAHVLEMPHKMAMDGPTWLAVQRTIYEGWGAKLMWLDVLAMGSLAALGIRFLGIARAAALVALSSLLVADVVIFAVWIGPTNAAVDAAGAAPMDDWIALRRSWEWGHAARAVVLTAGTAFAVLAAPTSTPRGLRPTSRSPAAAI